MAVPLARHGFLTAVVLGFAHTIGEFGVVLMIGGSIPGETRTIPLAIYTALQTPDGEDAAVRLVVLSIVVSIMALAASEWMARRLAHRLGGVD